MKKVIFFCVLLSALVCIFALGVSAATVYKDEGGTELFRCEIADGYHIESYEALNGGFAKVDSDGDALTWYLVSTENEGENTVKVVKSVKTKEVFENGAYTTIKKSVVVSANYDADVDKLPAFGAYSSTYSKELLFIYIPDAVKTLPQRFCQNVPVIECVFGEDSQCESWETLTFWGAKSLRGIFIPKNFKKFPCSSDGEFTYCTRMETLTFHKESTLEEWPGWYFGATKIKEITVPDSITYLNSRAFQGMSYLEYVDIGKNVTHLYKTDHNNSMFHSCVSLKTVIIPGGLKAENMIDVYGGGFDYSFSSSNPTIIYTGTLEEFMAIKAVFAKAGNNSGITNATVENGRIVIADHCETYYGGHIWKGETEIILESYFEKIGIGDSCINCSIKETKETIDAIFEWRGYSACTYGNTLSIAQCFGINRQAVELYKSYATDFDFGIFATVNKTGDAYAPALNDEDVIHINFDNSVNNFFDVKVTGIPLEKGDALIVFCMYVTEGETVRYLDGGVTGTTVTGISYNSVASE